MSILTKYRGRPSFRLAVEDDPAAWMAALSYSEWLSEVDPSGATELERELYEVYPSREGVDKPHRWNDTFKEITRIRRYYLADRVEQAGFYDSLDEDDQKRIEKKKKE